MAAGVMSSSTLNPHSGGFRGARRGVHKLRALWFLPSDPVLSVPRPMRLVLSPEKRGLDELDEWLGLHTALNAELYVVTLI